MDRVHLSTEFKQELDQKIQEAKHGQATFSGEDDAGRSLARRYVAEAEPASVIVSVPAAPDQVERVALDVAAQLGRAALGEVDAQLRRAPDAVFTSILDAYLEDRPLVVDGRDFVGDLGNQTDESL